MPLEQPEALHVLHSGLAGYHLGRSPVQTHGSQRGSVPRLAVGFRWLRWSQQVGGGGVVPWAVAESVRKVNILGLFLPTA